MSIDPTQLLQTLVEQFDLEELRTLCFDLGIDFDNLRGESKAGKARELVLYTKRRQQLDHLVARVQELRPDVPQVHPAPSRKDTAPGTAQALHIETGGGAVILGDVTTGGGDFVGRDRLSGVGQPGQGVHGPQPDVTGEVSSPRQARQRRERQIASLHTQLEAARDNLLLIHERKSQYVMETDIPLDLIRRERQLEGQIADLEAQLSALDLPESSELSGRFQEVNPFGDTGRITDAAHFFDREELLRQVFEELGKGANVSLVGQSQVGKSSLLSMVCALGPERMETEPEAFAYLSLEWVDDEDDFYEALCDALGIENCRGYKLTRALRGKRYVLCLDEIEKMTWDGFTMQVRSRLRGLADGPSAPLRLVIASRSSLSSLFPDSAELTSPLAGICHRIDVGPFPPDVARAFLAQRLQGTGVAFTESEITALLADTGGHPAKLQRAAADLFRSK
jgi:hypothetical protein